MLIIGNKVEEVIEDQEYLNDSLQELQREDNEPV
jgi:heme exporter protein D